jgi:transposase
MDGAGWRHSFKLILPDNLRTLFLPPYSPELNPQEHLGDELREKHFYNKAFNSLSALENTLASAWLSLENNHQLVRSIAY